MNMKIQSVDGRPLGAIAIDPKEQQDREQAAQNLALIAKAVLEGEATGFALVAVRSTGEVMQGVWRAKGTSPTLLHSATVGMAHNMTEELHGARRGVPRPPAA